MSFAIANNGYFYSRNPYFLGFVDSSISNSYPQNSTFNNLFGIGSLPDCDPSHEGILMYRDDLLFGLGRPNIRVRTT